MRKCYITAHRAAGIAMLYSMLSLSLSVSGQEIWPGDINSNGVVNGIDLLYHGVAEGAMGPGRISQGDNWEAHDAGPNWSMSFSDGINYSYADANGKGKVERRDRKIIWENNYGMTNSEYVPDVYPVVNSLNAPQLSLVPASSMVFPGEPLQFDIYLGDAANTIHNFYGITFKLRFDPDVVKDETSAPLWNPNVVSLTVNNRNWSAPTADNELESFLQLNNDAGEIEVVIMREKPEAAGGYGQIASTMVIFEDVVMIENVATSFVLEDIMMVDENLNRYPVRGSETYITVLANASAMQTNVSADSSSPEATASERQVPSPQPIKNNDSNEHYTDTGTITVYPNPVVDRLQAQVNTAGEEIVELRLFNANGQLLHKLPNVQARSVEMDMSHLPSGNYVLQLETTTGTTVKKISK